MGVLSAQSIPHHFLGLVQHRYADTPSGTILRSDGGLLLGTALGESGGFGWLVRGIMHLSTVLTLLLCFSPPEAARYENQGEPTAMFVVEFVIISIVLGSSDMADKGWSILVTEVTGPRVNNRG